MKKESTPRQKPWNVEQAMTCSIHKAVIDRCLAHLHERGYFSKRQVLDELNFFVDAGIRWDLIIEIITKPIAEGGFGGDLVPLAQRFFAASRKERAATAENAVGRFIAGGHGKKTAGWASVELDGGKLALHRIKSLRATKNGVGVAFDGYLDSLSRANAKSGDNPVLLDEVVEQLDATVEADMQAAKQIAGHRTAQLEDLRKRA